MSEGGPSAPPASANGPLKAILDEIEAWPVSEGIKISDLMLLGEPLSTALNQVVREGSASLHELAELLSLPDDQAHLVVDQLLQHGFLKTVEAASGGGVEYRLWYAPAHRREKRLDVWSKVMDHLGDDE